jgi:threonine/homoserine/homoserine lactone efflux protein
MQLAAYWPGLLSVFAASFVAFLSPGPNFVGIVSTTVTNRTNGLAVAVGCSLGTTFWALMAVTGLTALLALHPFATTVMQIVGGGYLMWLGLKSLRSSWRKGADPTLTASLTPESRWLSFRKGLLIQVTNPKTALFWLSMVSFIIEPETPAVVSLILVVGTTLIALSWHSVLAVAFAHPAVVRGYLARRRAISFVFGLAFLLLGGRLVGGAVNVLSAGAWA